MSAVLDDEGPMTVLAPSDDAWNQLVSGTTDFLQTDEVRCM